MSRNQWDDIGDQWNRMASKLHIAVGENLGRPCLIFSHYNRAYHLYDDDVRKKSFHPYVVASVILYVFNGGFSGEEHQYAKDTIMAAVETRQRFLEG